MCLEIHRKSIIVVVASLVSQSVEVKKQTESTGNRNPENKKERQRERERERQMIKGRMAAKRGGQGGPQNS